MAIAGKEIEVRETSVDERAAVAVDNYLERVEKQAEKQDTNNPLRQSTPQTAPDPVVNQSGRVIMQGSVSRKPKIILPLTQSQMMEGARHPIIDAIRWCVEFAKMMIKKYPGRVFYKR